MAIESQPVVGRIDTPVINALCNDRSEGGEVGGGRGNQQQCTGSTRLPALCRNCQGGDASRDVPARPACLRCVEEAERGGGYQRRFAGPARLPAQCVLYRRLRGGGGTG